MNPNTTISFMAAQATRQQVERDAERGWMAEQAAHLNRSRKPDVRDTLKGFMAAIFERPRRVVREAAGFDKPACTASPHLDRVG